MEKENDGLSEWDSVINDDQVTTKEFDLAIAKMLELDSVKDEKKQDYSLANEAYEKQRSYVLDLLTRTGKLKYHSSMGTVSKAIKYSVSLPKDPDEKVKVLNYFKSLGDDVFNNVVSIYYQALNSYYNQQREKDPTFTIDGVGEPQRTEELRFRKA